MAANTFVPVFSKPGNVIGIVLSVMIRIAPRRPAAQKLSVAIEKIIVVRRHIDLGQSRFVRDHKRLSEISEVILSWSSHPKCIAPSIRLDSIQCQNKLGSL